MIRKFTDDRGEAGPGSESSSGRAQVRERKYYELTQFGRRVLAVEIKRMVRYWLPLAGNWVKRGFSHVGAFATRLDAHLLMLYPDRFLDEFGGEMGAVFAQALSGLDDSRTSPATRRLQMARLFFRKVCFFPRAYLDARRYQMSMAPGETPAGSPAYGEGEVTEAWVGRRAPWGEALMGALPFLLFGLAHLLEGVAELSGHYRLAFHLLDGSLNRPTITLTLERGVYFVCALGLLPGVLKGFPRWSYAYLGMSFYFGWIYNQQFYYGMFYKWWVWLPSFTAIVLGLLLTRSLQPLARLLQGAWNDWTRLSFALYAFVPILTIVFFDDDWGIFQLYGLFFDTLLVTAGAVAFLRSRTSWGRVLSLEAAILILVLRGILQGGWFGGPLRALEWSVFLSFFLVYFGFLLLPAVIGLLRRGMEALSAR